MYLTVLSQFSMKQVNTLGDICNENILLMSKRNVHTKTFLILIRNFGDNHIYLWYVEGDYCEPLLLNSKFPSDILSDSV
jgi:hypothetical protein